MNSMWIEILAVNIYDSLRRPGTKLYGDRFYRGERRKIDRARGEEFIAKGAAREIEDPSDTVPRPSIRLHIQDVKHNLKEVKHG